MLILALVPSPFAWELELEISRQAELSAKSVLDACLSLLPNVILQAGTNDRTYHERPGA